MRKTPLSAPGGSYHRKNNHDWNYRDRRVQGCDDRSGPGYGHMQTDNNHSGCFIPVQNQPSPQKAGDDFIPLGYSSPVNHNQRPSYNNSGNWRGRPNNGFRHRGTTPPSPGGFNNSFRRNYYHDTPKSALNFNESNPRRFHQKHHFGPRRPHQRDAHREVNISSYLNVKSFLEDPWADLVRNLEKRDQEIGIEAKTPDFKAGGSKCGDILAGDGAVEADSTDLNSVFQETEVAVDVKPEITSATTTATTITITNAAS